MNEFNSKPKQEEQFNTTRLSIDHTAEGKRYIEQGLQLIKNGDINNAVKDFFHTAVELEKAQLNQR